MSDKQLSLDGAEQLVETRLGASPRAAHSRFVGLLMERLAAEFGADAGLWRIVGLVHDLDYFAVGGDWSRHGPLTAEWLNGRLPEEALAAIAAHDHRAGRPSSTMVAQMLRLADGLAVLDENAGRERTLAALRGTTELADVVGKRSFLVEIIAATARHHGVALTTLAGVLAGLPRQE